MDTGSSKKKQSGYFLAEKLKTHFIADAVVVSVSKESSETACHLAEILQAPWQVHSCREILHPGDPNKTIGSVCSDEILLHHDSLIPCDYIHHHVQSLKHDISSDNGLFSHVAGVHELKNKTVIVVCDYLNNYDSVGATLKSINNQRPLKTLVASIIVKPETARLVASFVDGIVFLEMAVSSHENAHHPDSEAWETEDRNEGLAKTDRRWTI